MYRKLLLYSSLLIPVCFLAICSGCRKKDTGTYVDGISASGCFYVGGYIQFSFRIKGSGSVAIEDPYWTFGDGTASNSPSSPVHIYSSAGTYTATFQMKTGKPVSTTFQVAANPLMSAYTVHMAGVRAWKGSAYGMINEFGVFGLVSPVVDTQFKLEVVSDGVVKIPFFYPGMTLFLQSEDTVDKVLMFKDCLHNTATLRYYYDTDSLFYSNHWTQGHGYESFDIHSP